MRYIAGRVPTGAPEAPLGGALTRGQVDFLDTDYDHNEVQMKNVRFKDGNVNTSLIRNDPQERHMIALDVDVPVQVYPSSTPGHSHLYIEKPVTQVEMMRVVGLLAQLGIVEDGYAEASAERGYTCLRLPWVRKRRRAPLDVDGFAREKRMYALTRPKSLSNLLPVF